MGDEDCENLQHKGKMSKVDPYYTPGTILRAVYTYSRPMR